MELKIITNGTKVNIFESQNISYDILSYKNSDHFIEKAQIALDDFDNQFSLGCDAVYGHEECDDKIGSFINLRFKSNNEYYSIVVKHSIIYVTNNGKTIDSYTID